MKLFYEISQNRYFWIAVTAYFLLMEAIALYYQYVLDTYPCALCVQIRAWVWGAVLFSAICAVMCKHFWWRWLGLTLSIACIAGGIYTSWYAWGVENGTIISSCSMGAGFPEFMPLDQWIPLLFAAEGFCGQSPDMWFGLSMVEGLLITLSIPCLVLIAQWLLHLPHVLSAMKGSET